MGIGIPMSKDHDEQLPRGAHSHRDKALLANGVVVFARQGVFVAEHSGGFPEGNRMFTPVGECLERISVAFRQRHCMDKRIRHQSMDRGFH